MADIDPDQMVQVLTNLFTNCPAGHVRKAATITIDLSDDAGAVTIKVTDTGEGIPEENMANLFDPFFTTKQVGMGTGFGLAVTHGIVKMHKGQIAVESNADRSAGPTGTTFTVTLPRHEEDGGRLDAQLRHRSSEWPWWTTRCRSAWPSAASSPSTRCMSTTLAWTSPTRTPTSPPERQFLESMAAGDEYDLLLLDLKLPGMSGLDVLEELDRQSERHHSPS